MLSWRIKSCLIFLVIGLAMVVFVQSKAYAYSSPGKPTSYVNDFAEVLDESGQAELELQLSNFEKDTSNEVVVVTVNSLDGDSIENYANELSREWGIGQKDKNNGVLLLVSVGDRRVRIEVGYGLEGALPDALAGRIISGDITPKFKANDYLGGVKKGVESIKLAIKGEYVSSGQPEQSKDVANAFFWVVFLLIYIGSFMARTKSWWFGGVIGAIGGGLWAFALTSFISGVIALSGATLTGLLLDYLLSKNYKNLQGKGGSVGWFGSWGGFKGGGGGFGGFGGGSSGGGGASGSW